MTPKFKQFDKVCLALAQQIIIQRRQQAKIAFIFQKLAILNHKESSRNMLLFEAKRNEIENSASLDFIAYSLLLTQTEGMLYWATKEFAELAENNTLPENNAYIKNVTLGLSANTQRIAKDKKDFLSLLEDSPFSCTQLEQAEVQSYPLDYYHAFKKQKMSPAQESDSDIENNVQTDLHPSIGFKFTL